MHQKGIHIDEKEKRTYGCVPQDCSRLAVVKIPLIVGFIHYLTQDNIIDGVFIICTDMTQTKVFDLMLRKVISTI